jgi:hypothetical protein
MSGFRHANFNFRTIINIYWIVWQEQRIDDRSQKVGRYDDQSAKTDLCRLFSDICILTSETRIELHHTVC